MPHFCVTYGRQRKNKYYVYFFAVGGEKINPPPKGGVLYFLFRRRERQPKKRDKGPAKGQTDMNLTNLTNLTNIEIPNFRIIIDNREQTPLPFSPAVPTRRGTLYPGDYSIEGHTRSWAVERKSIADLIGSLIGYKRLADGTRRNNRDRLIEELTAMRGFNFAAVIVTGPRYAIEGHQYQSRVEPANVMGMIASIEAFTGVPFVFYDSPEEAARWVATEALHYWRLKNGLSTLRPKLRADRLKPRALPPPPPPPPPVD